MSSKRRQEGYLLIDHRNSPGMPLVPGGTVFESATITCCHCQTVVILNPDRTRPRGYCQKCDHYICDNPVCHLECRPFKALADRVQTAAITTVADQNQAFFHLNKGD